jgi:hypothetical protein
MINHARTLLMNVDANSQPPEGCPGEELIDPGYKAVTLPTYLQQVRAILFGPSPDRAMLNYRLAQLLGMVLASDLQAYVLKLDPRITYPSATDLLTDDAFGLKYLDLSGAGIQLGPEGLPAAPDATGGVYYDFLVTNTGENQVQVVEYTPTFQNRFCNSLNETVPLGNSGYSLLVPPVGGPWKVWAYNRPQWDPGQLAVSLETVGEAVLLQLFGVQPTGPYAYFQSLWSQHPLLTYKLGGLVMAIAYRTEEIRTGVSIG